MPVLVTLESSCLGISVLLGVIDGAGFGAATSGVVATEGAGVGSTTLLDGAIDSGGGSAGVEENAGVSVGVGSGGIVVGALVVSLLLVAPSVGVEWKSAAALESGLAGAEVFS